MASQSLMVKSSDPLAILAAVGAEGHTEHGALMAEGRKGRPAGGGIPDSNSSVVARRGQPRAIGMLNATARTRSRCPSSDINSLPLATSHTFTDVPRTPPPEAIRNLSGLKARPVTSLSPAGMSSNSSPAMASQILTPPGRLNAPPTEPIRVPSRLKATLQTRPGCPRKV